MVQVQCLEARNGQPTLQAITGEGRTIFLHSSYNPEREAATWAQQLDWNEDEGTLLVLYGLGLGYHLRALLPRLPAKQKIIVVEPNEEVLTLARNIEANRFLFDGTHIGVVSNWKEFKSLYLQIRNPWKKAVLFRIPAYASAYEAEYLSFLKKFRSEMVTLVSDQSTVLFFSREWQTNFLKNLRHLPHSAPVAPTFGSFQKMPLVLVSAGPSLEKNIRVLRRAKGKALLLAVGTVVKLLLKNDICPDLIISFDGGYPNYLHFQDVHLPNVPLIYDPAIHHRILDEYTGPKAIMLVAVLSRWLEEYLDQPLGFLQIGPSIANTAFDFAYQLGADPIIFVGQDLAYTGNRSHAAGTDVDERLPTVSVEGVEGGHVLTSNVMLTYLHWFEEKLKTIDPGRTIINATEGGAKIHGSVNLTLANTLELFCHHDITPSIHALTRALSRPPEYDLHRFLQYVKSAGSSLERLLPDCKKGAQLTERLVDHYSSGRPCDVAGILKALRVIDRKLKKIKEKYSLIHYVIQPALGVISSTKINEQHAELDISLQSHQLYSSLKEAFEFTLPFIHETIDNLEKSN